jgi:anhydro-N-acetylmuramic acid kinase
MALPPLKYHHVIGIMSGTSLDGLDLAYCVFKQGNSWKYEVRKAETIPYPEELRHQLSQAMTLSGYELALLHNELGRFIGLQVKEFMANFAEEVELIASHGHTVFHRPELGLTVQIGNGAVIAANCGKPVVCDFRTTDVALGGQGAPLVPIGDELLFGQYDICLNLGGISNLSYRANEQRKAYDISPCNIVLNNLAQQYGKAYDANGEIAQTGHIDTTLLEQFNQLDYYRQLGTKSLGREWIDSQFFPLLKRCQLSIPDQMRTVCEHIAQQIANACNSTGIKSYDSNGDMGNHDEKTSNTTGSKTLLITGGGAHNTFLIDLIRQKFDGQVIIPDDKTIDFKEAIIFAFLGFLRINDLTNCLASVTGARGNSCGGGVYEANS